MNNTTYKGNHDLISCAMNLLLRTSQDMVFVKDNDLVYRGASFALVGMLGLDSLDDVLGKTDLDLFEETLACKYLDDDRRVLESGNPIIDMVEAIPDTPDAKRFSSTCKYAVRDAGGRTIGLLGIGRDITDEVRNRHALEIRAETDDLTGLLNRKGLFDRINAYLGNEGIGGKHALLFIDLDDFKHVNDIFGHPMGDRILGDVARTLNGSFRQSDIIGRCGGDEFIVLLKDIERAEDVTKRVEKMSESFPLCYSVGDEEVRIGCSVGAALYGENGTSVKELYREADAAMYRAKEGESGKLVFAARPGRW